MKVLTISFLDICKLLRGAFRVSRLLRNPREATLLERSRLIGQHCFNGFDWQVYSVASR